MSSRIDTEQALGMINDGLRTRYAEGDPIRLELHGRPMLHILAFDPIAYESYGRLHNKAPFVAGSLALRAFLSAPKTDGKSIIVAGVEAGQEGYGFYISPNHPDTAPFIETVAEQFGFEVSIIR